MVDLGTFGGTNSFGYDVNSNGAVVGTAQNAAGESRAFIYTNGVLTDLNVLLSPSDGWVLQNATAINDQGMVVGWGMNSGIRRAYLLRTQ